MPLYRFIKPLPVEVTYRDGTKVLIDTFVGVQGEERLRARKTASVSDASVILFRALRTSPIANQLEAGFEADPAPAAQRVMQGLVALGYARYVVD